MKTKLKIVPISQIPNSKDTPVSDLMDIYKIFLDMEMLCKKESGLGLSAVQVGIPYNMFIVMMDGVANYYVNCIYEPVSFEQMDSIEGCLSIFDSFGKLIRYKLTRYSTIRVKGSRLGEKNGKPILLEVDKVCCGLESIIFQHEIDHSFGKLISHIGTPIEVWR